MSIALVTGATGTVGPALVQGLLAGGYRVRALVRPTSAPLPAGVEAIPGDLTEPESLRRACDGASLLFHLAAKLHINQPDPSLRAEYERTNVEGTAHLLEAARAGGVERFLLFSTISVYGPGWPGVLLTEASPARPATLYAETKRRAEEIALDFPGSVVLRLAAVYGPHMKGNYLQLARALRRGLFVPVGDGSNRRTLVHERDVAAAALLAARHPAACGEIFNVTDGELHTLREIVAAIAGALGKAPPRWYLPVGPVRAAAALCELPFRLMRRRAPLGRQTVEKLTEDVAVSGDKLRAELGFRPEVELREGWRSVLRDGAP